MYFSSCIQVVANILLWVLDEIVQSHSAIPSSKGVQVRVEGVRGLSCLRHRANCLCRKLRGKDLGPFFQEKIMKDILVVGMLKEGQFPRFMGFMQSEEGIAERKKIADLTQTIGTVAPDHSKVMFKIAVHDMDALHAFLNGSNPVSKPVFDEVMDGYEIYELNRV